MTAPAPSGVFRRSGGERVEKKKSYLLKQQKQRSKHSETRRGFIKSTLLSWLGSEKEHLDTDHTSVTETTPRNVVSVIDAPPLAAPRPSTSNDPTPTPTTLLTRGASRTKICGNYVASIFKSPRQEKKKKNTKGLMMGGRKKDKKKGNHGGHHEPPVSSIVLPNLLDDDCEVQPSLLAVNHQNNTDEPKQQRRTRRKQKKRTKDIVKGQSTTQSADFGRPIKIETVARRPQEQLETSLDILNQLSWGNLTFEKEMMSHEGNPNCKSRRRASYSGNYEPATSMTPLDWNASHITTVNHFHGLDTKTASSRSDPNRRQRRASCFG